MAAFKAILFTVDGAVATLTLNRPSCGNALCLEIVEDIQQALQLIEQDRHIRALIVTGAGPIFCSGLDGADGTQSDTNGESFAVQTCSSVLAIFRASQVPIVMAINGMATGVGCGLAWSGDVLLAAHSASFLPLVVQEGSSAEETAHNRSMQTVKEPISAAQALQNGMISECASADELLPRARELAARLAVGPTRALVMTRQLVDAGQGSSFEAQYRRELEVNQQLRESVDGIEGVRAFLQKRVAQFRGE